MATTETTAPTAPHPSFPPVDRAPLFEHPPTALEAPIATVRACALREFRP